MGTEERDEHSTVGEGLSVDYKTLFLGSCTLIVLLGGAAFRIWDSANQREASHSDQFLTRIEQRLTELETRSTEGLLDRRNIHTQLDDHEDRIREYERGHAMNGGRNGR